MTSRKVAEQSPLADTVRVLASTGLATRCAAVAGAACLSLAACTAATSGRPQLAGCGATAITTGKPPAWAAGNAPTLPHAVSEAGNVVGILFGYPLTVHRRSRSNKVLWVVRQPRDGNPLVITAHAGTASVHVSFPADSSPGEIYPSIVDVPRAGCWRFTLAWGPHVDHIDLPYRA
jgi:hypothetical protein